MRSTDDGFEVWYRAEHPRLVAVLALESGDVEVARDAASEAFARALERWERVATMASPASWTYKVALNVVRRHKRRLALERLALRRRGPQLPAPSAGVHPEPRASSSLSVGIGSVLRTISSPRR